VTTPNDVPLPEPEGYSSVYMPNGEGERLANGCYTADQMHAYGDARVAAERARIAAELDAAISSEGFGCACEPAFKCGTCKARDTLGKAIGPLLRELRGETP